MGKGEFGMKTSDLVQKLIEGNLSMREQRQLYDAVRVLERGNPTPVYGPIRNWTPAFGGFATPPAGGIYRFTTFGFLAWVSVSMPNNGDSDSTEFNLTLPFNASNLAASYVQGGLCYAAVNNGAALTGGAYWRIQPGSNVIDLYTDAAPSGWIDSGGKRASFSGFIEIVGG